MLCKKEVTSWIILLFIMQAHVWAWQNDRLAEEYPVIPTPKEAQYGKEVLTFNGFDTIISDFRETKEQLELWLTSEGIKSTSHGIQIQIVKSNDPEVHHAEAYKLIVDTDIKIMASTEKGALYAIQTLKQILRKKEQAFVFPQVEITDWPAFKIRGFMHDTGRNFQSVAQLKEQIEVLARYKYNVFHWHLTDDPGWRLESKIYPQLQSKAATSRHKGKFYTQNDFKEILAFCKARNITLIPEFDIPGHSQAFRKAMGFETMKDEQALPVLLNLFDELCGLASSEEMPYIHIGTDEVRNREEYVSKDFIKKIMDRIKSHDRELIVWKEGIEIEEDSTSINQLWAQHSPRNGHRFIDSRANYINHLDPFAGMVRLYFQQPCRQPKGDSLALGGILCAWPDNNVAHERDIIKQNPIYPSMLFYVDAIWNGRPTNEYDYWAKLPPVGSELLKKFKAFEDKVLVHRDLFFQDKEFPYVKQTDIVWNLIGPFDHNGNVEAKFPIEDTLQSVYQIKGENYKWSEPKVGGTLHLKHFFGFPAVTEQKTGTFYAYTELYSPNDRTQDFWIGFQGWSRSGGRRVGPFPDIGQWHTTKPKIWVNKQGIAPPVWKQPNLGTKTDEIPFIDEDYFFRPPTKIKLKKGWNRIVLKIPQDQNSWKWMFTCVPIQMDNGWVSEVKELKFRAPFNQNKQITLNTFPKDYQLFPRNSQNKASINISGTANASIDSLIVKVHRPNNKISRQAYVAKSDFLIPIEIEAQKHNYTIELLSKNDKGEEKHVKKANYITAGDVYVLSGQSNAWAIDYNGVYSTKNLPNHAQWVRTVGAMHVYNKPAIYPEATDVKWYLASGKAPDIRQGKELVGAGMVGVLGLNIGMDLVNSQNIPIAIINGAGGGGAISYYQKTTDRDLNVPYGRLQHRIESAGLEGAIKAFIWNQGENNAADSTIEYKTALDELYKNLKTDFSFEKFYLVQTPPGCHSKTGHQNVREAQRQFAGEQENVRILTRHGIPENPKTDDGNYFLEDGCHYHAHGYEVLAQWITGMANYDFYMAKEDYQAPQLKGITLKSPTVLAIDFDKPVVVQPDLEWAGSSYSLKKHAFAINGKPLKTIVKLKVRQQHPKTVLLKVKAHRFKKGDVLTYLVGDNYPATNTPYQGPWIVEAQTGVGAVGFTESLVNN